MGFLALKYHIPNQHLVEKQKRNNLIEKKTKLATMEWHWFPQVKEGICNVVLYNHDEKAYYYLIFYCIIYLKEAWSVYTAWLHFYVFKGLI